MATIYWIAEKDGYSMEIWGFNNKGKAQDKAMELSTDFSFGDTEIPKDGNEDGEDWLYSGEVNAGNCFILGRADNMPNVEGFDSVADAKAYAEDNEATGACFPIKLRGGMGSVYMASVVEGNGRELFAFEDGELDREVKAKASKGKKVHKNKYPIELTLDHTKMKYPWGDRGGFFGAVDAKPVKLGMKWFVGKRGYAKKGVYPEYYKNKEGDDVYPSLVVVSGTKDGLAFMLYMEYYGGHAHQSVKDGDKYHKDMGELASIDEAWPKIMKDYPELKGANINKYREDWMGESKTILESFKYVPTFESFLNEAKVELGSIDSRSMDDKWKMEQVNDILKGAIGKTCTALDIKSIAGRQIKFIGDDEKLKNIECKIKDIDVSGSYADLVHFVGFTYDKDDGTEVYNRFIISYPKANSNKGLEIFSKFADIFGLGDITPNFPDAKGNVTDYDNVDYYGKLSVNCYQFIKGSMSKMVSFMEADDVRLYRNDHTFGAGMVLCNKKDLKKIHADLLDGFEGKKPRLNNIPMIGLDAKAEENGSVVDSPIYQKKWAKVCQFLGARDTSDLVCVNILMRLGGPSKNHANNSFSEEEIKHAKVAYNGFSGWSRANVPEGIAPLVKRIRVKKYAGGKLS